MAERVLPCPFCNGEAHLTSVLRDGYADYQDDPDARAYFYVCYSCAAQGGWGKSEGRALHCWNMRTPATAALPVDLNTPGGDL